MIDLMFVRFEFAVFWHFCSFFLILRDYSVNTYQSS